VASAQLAITQPTEKLLLLPLPGVMPGDSAASIAVMDLARDRIQQLARYKVQSIPKSKICEALLSFGFQCDPSSAGPMYILDQSQAAQFAKSVSINSYDVGSFTHTGNLYTARVRLISGGSGFAAAFTATGDGQPAVAESLAQHLLLVIKAAEFARECDDRRGKGNLSGAMESARKAFAIAPNLTAAHLCVYTVFEAQRMGPDSLIAAAQRALKGDSMSATAWSRLASVLQQKGDTLRWLDALQSWAGVESENVQLQLSVADQLMKSHVYPKATALLKTTLTRFPSNVTAKDMLRRSCIEGSQWRCVLDLLAQEEKDSAVKLRDSSELKLAIGASTALPDTQAWLHYTQLAVTQFPKNGGFCNTRGQALEAAGQVDSAIGAYKACAALAPTDPRPSLLVAATILNHAVYDTLKAPKDTIALAAYQNAYADKVDAARPFIQPALAGTDTALRINAAALLLTGGSGIARAGRFVYPRAYGWLEQLLTVVQPATPTDTIGPKQQIRIQGSFWFGLTSTITLGEAYAEMTKHKSCEEAKVIQERINRSKDALFLGGRIAPAVATQMLGFLDRYNKAMPQVKAAFKCTNF
jgi:tetratricopeptide (TPR) repeat protein